ncbi:MAG: lipocalin-like domain-containing protein [Xanthobacteraceae bacterium]
MGQVSGETGFILRIQTTERCPLSGAKQTRQRATVAAAYDAVDGATNSIGPKRTQEHAISQAFSQRGKTLTYQIEASSFPNWCGVTQKREFSISGDELRFSNSASSSGATVVGVLKKVR